MSKLSKGSKRSTRSSTGSTARRKAEAEWAAVLAQAEGLKKKLLLLRNKRLSIKQNIFKKNIKTKKEMLTVETQ